MLQNLNRRKLLRVPQGTLRVLRGLEAPRRPRVGQRGEGAHRVAGHDAALREAAVEMHLQLCGSPLL